MGLKIILVGLIFWVSCVSQFPQRGTYRIMFYNVENLFYPEDDSLTMDDEFTPEGSRHWTWTRYRKKLAGVARVIIAAGEGRPPEVVGLCEIENSRVLTDLAGHPLLLKYDYRFIHRDSPDPRGIDVALLYREGFTPTGYHFHPVQFPGTDAQTRDILHVRGILGRKDSVDFIVNHWTSKYGDVVSSASKRLYQSGILCHIIDSLRTVRDVPFIIAMGDFNENEDDPAMQKLTDDCPVSFPAYRYTDPAVEGTYKYRGRWECIDHFLISGAGDDYQVTGTVFSIPPLLEPDEGYTGIKPARTYTGYSYQGGVSDHLPVILDITRQAR